jgi:hypothetical protein
LNDVGVLTLGMERIQRQKERQNQQGFCSPGKKSIKNKLYHNYNLMLK